MLLMPATNSNAAGEGMTAKVRQNDIAILCPDQIAYHVQSVEQWDAGMYGLKRLPFSHASVSGRLLYCTYEVNNGVSRDTSTLTKAMPNGYICSVYNSGGKRRQFQCKRPAPPIKKRIAG